MAKEDKDQFRDEAVRLFDEKICDLWKGSLNVWRTAWAMDTLIDYFDICGIDGSSFAQSALDLLNPENLGNWWDDFGWIGIASLRAAERNVFSSCRNDFVKIAINAWAYMHGPGWSKQSQAVYPFTGSSLPGWEEFALSHQGNMGAPNVWKEIEKSWPSVTEQERTERKPRYSPGGAWNSPISDAMQPELSPGYSGAASYLNSVQNTVTNGLYTILSLRIHQALKSGEFEKVFVESGIDRDAPLAAWRGQIGWLERWLLGTDNADESLLFNLDGGVLVRERVSTMGENRLYWDAAYCKRLIWTGDQGLLIGALREGSVADYLDSPLFGLYPAIVKGVFENLYARRNYGPGIAGKFLLPWTVIGVCYPYDVRAPGGDTSDYQTGNGVLMRYLLQGYRADKKLLDPYKESILSSARSIIGREFGTKVEPDGECDAYTPMGAPVDEMTAYVNRLSVLLLAIEMSG